MSVSAQIDRLERAKAEIVAALIAKGVDVPNNIKLDEIAPLISKLSHADYAYDYAKKK